MGCRRRIEGARCDGGSVFLVRDVVFAPPVRLREDVVDVFELDVADAVAYGFQQGGQAEISGFAQDAFGRAGDQAQRVVREGVVSECDTVELPSNEFGHVIGGEFSDEEGARRAKVARL